MRAEKFASARASIRAYTRTKFFGDIDDNDAPFPGFYYEHLASSFARTIVISVNERAGVVRERERERNGEITLVCRQEVVKRADEKNGGNKSQRIDKA